MVLSVCLSHFSFFKPLETSHLQEASFCNVGFFHEKLHLSSSSHSFSQEVFQSDLIQNKIKVTYLLFIEGPRSRYYGRTAALMVYCATL
jgi:hypothetical protein